jgi:leucyl aminopeptidase (aminopeptidase T)
VRVAARVVLSPEERARLSRWAHARGAFEPRALRAQIILAAADGEQDLAIAGLLDLNRRTVAKWRRRFLASRLRGLADPTSPGLRPPRISAETVRAIVRRTVAGSSGRGPPPSTRSLAAAHEVSHTTVRRIWEAHHLRPGGVTATPLRAEPPLPLETRDVVGVFLHAPVYAIALTLAPRTGSGERTPLVPVGAAATAALDGRSPSSLHLLLGQLPEAGGRGSSERVRISDFLRWLSGVYRAAGPLLPVRVVMTPLPPVPLLDRWLLRHPTVRLDVLPLAADWKRQVYAEIQRAGQAPVPLGRRSRRGESARSLVLALSHYASDGNPFDWTATDREVHRGEPGVRLRYELSATGHAAFAPRGGAKPPGEAAGREDDAHARRMARTVLREALRMRPGENLLVETWTETLPYANAFVLEARRLGARPVLLYEDEPTFWATMADAPVSHLRGLGNHHRALVERSDAMVSFFGPSDRERFHALPRRVCNAWSDAMDGIYRAAARGGVRAVQMALGRASAASARMYGVDLPTWRRELVEGALVDPAELARRARRVVAPLEHGERVRITHPNGTDLELRLKHRRTSVSDGRVGRAAPKGTWELVTVPAGVVAVAVDERYAEGTYRSNVLTSAGMAGPVGELAGGTWTFEHGRLTRFRYDLGHATFADSFAGAGPGRDRPAALSIGLNDRLSIAPLLEDQSLGMTTLQVGRNDHLGGATHAAWWAWLYLRGADIRVDGEPIVRGGRLVA